MGVVYDMEEKQSGWWSFAAPSPHIRASVLPQWAVMSPNKCTRLDSSGEVHLQDPSPFSRSCGEPALHCVDDVLREIKEEGGCTR